MTTQIDLRKYLCKKCDYNGWITRDEYGDRLTQSETLTLTKYDKSEMEVTTVHTIVKMCSCLQKIRDGYYSNSGAPI